MAEKESAITNCNYMSKRNALRKWRLGAYSQEVRGYSQ